MLLAIYAAPLVLAAAAFVLALIRSFCKPALILSIMVAMVSEMLATKYLSNNWYMFLYSILVPLAVSYILLSLCLMARNRKKDS